MSDKKQSSSNKSVDEESVQDHIDQAQFESVFMGEIESDQEERFDRAYERTGQVRTYLDAVSDSYDDKIVEDVALYFMRFTPKATEAFLARLAINGVDLSEENSSDSIRGRLTSLGGPDFVDTLRKDVEDKSRLLRLKIQAFF